MRNRCEEGVISKYSGDRSKSIVEFLLRIAIHRWKQRFSIVFPAGRIASLKVATISRSVTSDSRPGDNVPDVFNFRPLGKLSREGTSTTTTTTMQRRPLPSVAIHHRYRDSSTFYKSSIQTSSFGRKKFKEEEHTRNFYFSLPKPASPPFPPSSPSLLEPNETEYFEIFFLFELYCFRVTHGDARIGNGRKLRFFGEGEFCEGTGEIVALSGVALANRYEGSRGYLGDGGLGCGDVQRPEKSPRNVATREEVEEEGGRRKVGSLESLAGVARGEGEVGRGGGGWTRRGSIQRCWTKVHSHLSGGREDADTGRGWGRVKGVRDEEGRLRRTRVRANRERE